MIQRATGPSRLVQSIARWAITLGSAGTLVGAIAMYGVVLGKEVVSNRRGTLMLSAILLSLAFVLAPLVRRTFSNPRMARKIAAPTQRTLLEELREVSPGAATAEAVLESDAAAATPAAEVSLSTSFTARLVIGAYVLFAATLLIILWALQTT